MRNLYNKDRFGCNLGLINRKGAKVMLKYFMLYIHNFLGVQTAQLNKFIEYERCDDKYNLWYDLLNSGKGCILNL